MDDGLFDLSGQVALVTGGNSGIGLGLATGLARAGSAVCIWGTNAGKNAAALEALRSTGADVMAMIVDVSQEQAVEDGMNAVVSRYRLSGLVLRQRGRDRQVGQPAVRGLDARGRARRDGRQPGRHVPDPARGRPADDRAGHGGQRWLACPAWPRSSGAPREVGDAAAKAAILAPMRTWPSSSASTTSGRTPAAGLDAVSVVRRRREKPGVGDRIRPRRPLRRWGEPKDWAGIAVYLAARRRVPHRHVFRIDGAMASSDRLMTAARA